MPYDLSRSYDVEGGGVGLYPETFYYDGVTPTPCYVEVEIVPAHEAVGVSYGVHDASEGVPASVRLLGVRLASGQRLTMDEWCDCPVVRADLANEVLAKHNGGVLVLYLP